MPLEFTNSDIRTFQQDRLMRIAGNLYPGVDLSEGYIKGQLNVAARDLERQLRVWLTPREVVPEGTPQADIDALKAAGNEVEIEPGYDYSPMMFQGDSWGFIETRHRPIINVTSMTFNFPTPKETIWNIPLDWLRLDKKYGQINIVPLNSAMFLPLNAYLLSVIGGGRNLPLMLRIRYRAGMQDIEDKEPDIWDLIFKMAILSVIDDQYLPMSGSISADGLSESSSWDPHKYRDLISRRVETIRQSLHGVRFMVV